MRAGQNPEIAAGAARYMAISVPALFFQGLFQCLSRYLAAQGEVQPAMWAAGGCILLAPAVNWLLVFKLDLGLDGAAVSTVMICAMQSLLLLLLVLRRDRKLAGTHLQTWHGWCVLLARSQCTSNMPCQLLLLAPPQLTPYLRLSRITRRITD